MMRLPRVLLLLLMMKTMLMLLGAETPSAQHELS
jgi:hypothetical protein